MHSAVRCRLRPAWIARGRHRHGVEFSVWHSRAEGNGSGGRKTIHDAFKKGAEEPVYLEARGKLDQEPAYMSSDEYRRYAAAQLVEQKKLIEDLGLGPKQE